MRKMYLVKKNPEQPADGNNWIVMNGQKETAASHRMMYPMVLKNYIGGMAVVAMSGRPAQRQDQAARIARFAVAPESLRVSMTLRV